MPGNISDAGRHLRDIEAALARAASRAEKLARETGTPLVLWEDGHVVERLSDAVPSARSSATKPVQALK